jgi:hypothetical protein
MFLPGSGQPIPSADSIFRSIKGLSTIKRRLNGSTKDEPAR